MNVIELSISTKHTKPKTINPIKPLSNDVQVEWLRFQPRSEIDDLPDQWINMVSSTLDCSHAVV
jgi:hypothetical protein